MVNQINQVESFKRWHFVGIGGAGMSAIARILAERGFEVQGSDLKESRFTRQLSEIGVKVFIGHRAENIIGSEIVVFSSAIPSDNVELAEARKKGLPVLSRADALSFLTSQKKTVAVAGTHGKTTTTSMVARVLEVAGFEPTYIVGGELNEAGTNARAGKGDYLVVEADESDGTFLRISTFVSIVTNVEADHLDYFGDYSSIQNGFLEFIKNTSPEGVAIVSGDHLLTRELAERSGRDCLFYGLGKDNLVRAENVQLEGSGTFYDLIYKGKKLGSITLRVPGLHNLQNSLAAIAAGLFLGADFRDLKTALGSFSGVKRRFEFKGKVNGVTVVDDYAHHPSEVEATLKAASLQKFERIICVFQPHRFSRTSFLYRDFARSFDLADFVVLTDVYPAGEKPLPGVTGKIILEALLEEKPDSQVAYTPSLIQARQLLCELVKSGDLVLTVGAGDVTLLGEDFLRALEVKKLA